MCEIKLNGESFLVSEDFCTEEMFVTILEACMELENK